MTVWRTALFALVCSPLAATELADPTRPPAFTPYVPIVEARDLGDWKLNGITISDTARSAVLNGVVVVPGQQLGQAVVVDIQSHSVVLDVGGQMLTVELPRMAFKRVAKE